MLAHSVFFSLHDNSPEAIARLIEACKKYLPDHPGVLHFFVGTLNREFDRPVNDRYFDVALHLLFASPRWHDAYQVSPLHQQFTRENQSNWKQVRVFDSDVESK
jgi:hypothetical protein